MAQVMMLLPASCGVQQLPPAAHARWCACLHVRNVTASRAHVCAPSHACRTAEALGLGHYSEQELFEQYVEYLLLSLVDPG